MPRVPRPTFTPDRVLKKCLKMSANAILCWERTTLRATVRTETPRAGIERRPYENISFDLSYYKVDIMLINNFTLVSLKLKGPIVVGSLTFIRGCIIRRLIKNVRSINYNDTGATVRDERPLSRAGPKGKEWWNKVIYT